MISKKLLLVFVGIFAVLLFLDIGSAQWTESGRFANKSGYYPNGSHGTVGLGRLDHFDPSGTSLGFEGSAVVENGYVYVGGLNNVTYQLNASNVSDVISTYKTQGQIVSSPAINGNYLYVGSKDGYLYQLNATNISQQISNYSAGSAIFSSPTIYDGSLYLGVSTELYKLDPADVSNVQSSYSFGSLSTGLSTVAAGNPIGTPYVYVAGGNNLYQLPLDLSQISHNYTLSTSGLYDYFSDPTYYDGDIYIGSQNGKYYHFAGYDVSNLKSVYPSQGAAPDDRGEFERPAAAGGSIYVANQDSSSTQFLKLDSLDISTTQDSAIISDDPGIYSNPTVTDDYVYFATDGDKIYQYNRSNFQLEGRFKVGGDITGQPALSEDGLYIGSEGGKLYHFGKPCKPPYNGIDWILNDAHCFINESKSVGSKSLLMGRDAKVTLQNSGLIEAGKIVLKDSAGFLEMVGGRLKIV